MTVILDCDERAEAAMSVRCILHLNLGVQYQNLLTLSAQGNREWFSKCRLVRYPAAIRIEMARSEDSVTCIQPFWCYSRAAWGQYSTGRPAVVISLQVYALRIPDPAIPAIS